MLHGDCMTVTGKTLEENLSEIQSPDMNSNDIIFPISNPIKKTGHIQILKEILLSLDVLQKSQVKKV